MREGNYSSQRAISVLIVEDTPGDLTLMRRMLNSITEVRFEIIHASTLSNALEQLRFGTDVVLLDLNLPDTLDLDTLRRFREQQQSIPVIVLTGMEDRQKAADALAIGAQDYMVKGLFDANMLGQSILRHVKSADLQQS